MRVRSEEPERLDEAGLDPATLRQNLREIETINRWLGGHKLNTAFLSRVIRDNPGRPIHLLDLGAGGGDTLRALIDLSRRRGWEVTGTGADIHPVCVEFARERSRAYPELTFLERDCLHSEGLPKADVVMANLFAHHLYGDHLKALLMTMHNRARLGALVNDLHRHPLAEKSIDLITRLAGGSEYLRHDAPASVRKGFAGPELLDEARLAGWPAQTQVIWRWAFRYELSFLTYGSR